MKKTLDSSVIRTGLGVLVLALVLGSLSVVVSAADADAPVAAPTVTTVLPANLGSQAGQVAALQARVPTSTAGRTGSDSGSLLSAQTRGDDPTTTTEDTVADLASSTSTTTRPPTTSTTAPPASTTTTLPATTTTTAPPTTTTTTLPATTTTTAPPATTTTTAPAGAYTGVLSEAEAYELFSRYFTGSDLDTAMRVAICESSLNTEAYNPAGYGGLFQHSIDAWPERSAAAGWGGASIYDGEANTAVAAWLVAVNGGWSAWPSC